MAIFDPYYTTSLVNSSPYWQSLELQSAYLSGTKFIA